jgi:GT2 family glycosyltransferase
MISSDQITAVIPTYNRLFELERCVKSIYSVVKDIIIIDNNSSEDIQSLEKKYERVHVYSANRNMGPCAATNFGIKQSETPYILLVDNDTELLKWCNLPLDMDEDEAVQAFRIHGDKYFHMYSNSPDHPDWVQQLPWFYGCACLVNKKAWEKVGGYNEDYFAYYQECDISAKFWKNGYYISYNPSIVFAHHDSENARDHDKIKYWKARNLMWFCCEHLPFSIATYQVAKNIMVNLLQPQTLVRGYIDALKNMPKRDPIYEEFFLKVWRK